MSPAIEVYADGKLEATFDTSGNTVLPEGATDGDFEVVSGMTTEGGPLCTPDDPGPGEDDCPPAKVSELTLEYTGTASAVVGVAQKGKAVLFWDILDPGEQFTFEGYGRHHDMSPQIGVFLDGHLDATFDTDGHTALRVGQTSGDFEIVSGLTLDGDPLCDDGTAPDGRILFGTDVVAELALGVGQHKIELEVGDAGCTNIVSVIVEVIEAATAVQRGEVMLQSSGIDEGQKVVLSSALSMATTEFAKGRKAMGVIRLHSFLLKLKYASGPEADKRAIAEDVHKIIDALQ